VKYDRIGTFQTPSECRGSQSDGSSFSRAVYPRRNFPHSLLAGRVAKKQLFGRLLMTLITGFLWPSEQQS
jgi:hypothetical protein